ncbi:hypothetical protein [Aquimarina rhabdastrellae]
MQRLLIILIVLSSINIFCQAKDFNEIIHIETSFPRRMDTINGRLGSNWNKIKPEIKEKIRKRITDQKQNIESDTTTWTNLFYIGKKETIELKINSKSLNYTDLMPESYFDSTTGDSIVKIKLGSIKRNSGIKKTSIYLKDLRRFADFNLDTKYSEVYIRTEDILSIDDFKTDETTNAVEYDLNGLPVAPDTIEIIDEELIIEYRIPKRKHSW